MKKIGIIMWNVWTHRNQVVFKKVRPNPFLVIEKVTVIFQNLQEYLFYPYLHNKGRNVFHLVEKWIHWIPLINDRFKLNFDDSRVEIKIASGWVTRDSNGIIKTAACKHLGNTSIILAECMTLRDGILASKNNGFVSLEIEGDSKIVIDCFNKMISAPCSIRVLMEDIYNLSRDLNIHSCHHVYRESNRTVDCLAKKGIGILDSRNWLSNFPKDVTYNNFIDYYGFLSNSLSKLKAL